MCAAIGAGCEGEDGDGPSASDRSGSARSEQFGSPVSEAEASRVEADLVRYLGARVAGEWKEARAHLARSSRLLVRASETAEQIDGEGCAPAMAVLTERLSPSGRAGLAVGR